MHRALYDFAEAAIGKNTRMQWSISPSVLRRQVIDVFKRCADGDLSAEQALDVAADFVRARLENTLGIYTELFDTLEPKLLETFPSADFPPLIELRELFLGLNPESEWATSDQILRAELYPLFVRVALGNLAADVAVLIFCDNIMSKTEFYKRLVYDKCVALAKDVEYLESTEAGTAINDVENGHDGAYDVEE